MPLARLCRLVPACVCLSALATGCATFKDKGASPAGTFINGGGQYGQKAPDAEAALPTESVSLLSFWSNKPTTTSVGTKTKLAYAQWEERMGNYAAARKQPDEQRAAHTASRKAYEQVLEEDAKSVDAVIGLARLDEIAGRPGEAEQGFLKAVRMDNNSARSLDALGQFYGGQKRWSDALPTLQKAMASAPSDQAIRYHYAVSLARSGQIAEAEPHLIETVGKASMHYNIGVILHEQGEHFKSEERFVAALIEDPHLEQAQHWLQEIRKERQKSGPQVAQREFNVTTLRAGQPGATSPRESGPAVAPTITHAGGMTQPPSDNRNVGVIQQTSASIPAEPARPAPTAKGAAPVVNPPVAEPATPPSDQWDTLR